MSTEFSPMSTEFTPMSTEFSPVTEFTAATSVYDNTTTDPYWDDLPFAHPYWRQFNIADIPDEYHYAVAIWMTFFGIFGTLGNLLVIYTFVTTRHLRTPPNMLIVNLAVGDMTFSAVNGFPLLTISSINKIWSWGDLCCQLYGWVGGIMGLMSISTLAFIAMDRYYVVSRPLQAAKNMSKKKSFVYLVIIWLWSTLWSTPPLFGWGKYIPEGFQTSCTFDYLTQDVNNVSFNVGMYIGGFFMPVAIIVVCYIGIVKSVMKHHAEMMKTAMSMGATVGKSDKEKQQEIQTAKVAAISIGSFMLSWTPYATIALFGLAMPHDKKFVTPYMSEIPVMFAKASTSYNPIIYAISHPKYRAEIDRRFPWLLCCCKPKPAPPAPTRSATAGGSRTPSNRSHTEVESCTDIEMDSKAGDATNTAAANPAAGGNQCS